MGFILFLKFLHLKKKNPHFLCPDSLLFNFSSGSILRILRWFIWTGFNKSNLLINRHVDRWRSYVSIYEHQLLSYVQFSCRVMSDSSWSHEPQHPRPPCPSPTAGVHPNPCPLSRWCHPTISSSVIPFSSCLQSFPASGSFQMSQLFTAGGQSTGVSAF